MGDEDYGAIIFQKRQREGWSRRELEALTGISQNKLVRIETAGRDLNDEEFRALIRVVPELAQAEQEPQPEPEPEPEPQPYQVLELTIPQIEIEVDPKFEPQPMMSDAPVELINDYDRQPEPAPLPLLSTVLDIPQAIDYPPVVLGEPPSAEDTYPESSTPAVPPSQEHHQQIDGVLTTSSVGVDALYEGSARLISNSEFQTFKHCRRRWWLAYYRGLQLKDKPLTGPAPLGTRIHQALEHYYVPPTETPADPLETLEASISRDKRLVLSQYADLPERAAEELDKFNKDAEYARAMVEGYMDWLSETGADQGFEVVRSEKVLSTDLENIPGSDTPVRIRGKVDAELRREADNSTLFMDHKPQPLSAPVLTPTGWVKLGDLHVGDVISGAHGEPIRVTAVYDRGSDDVWKVTLNDGTSVEATADHPWMAKTYLNGKWKVIPTEELTTSHRLMSYGPTPADRDVSLPMDPYTLGAWIANGDRRGRGITDGVSDTLAATGLHVETIPKRTSRHKNQYLVRFSAEHQTVLDELNLLWLYSVERFIPHQYIHAASYGQRLALLRGLMDGDGTITTTRSSQYTTTSPRLSEDVAELVRSLGGWAKPTSSLSPSHVGTKTDGYDTNTFSYRVSVRSDFNPFAYIEHADLWASHKEDVRGHQGTTSTDKIVKSVEYAGRDDVRCIEVDSDKSLYVTSGYTVSHNTVGDFTRPAMKLRLDEQTKTYQLLEEDNRSEDSPRIDGAIYNMIRRVKRTQNAKPPFYQRLEIHRGPHEIDTFRSRLIGTSADILMVEALLKKGKEDHHSIVYPSPGDRCHWGCDFKHVCPMFDDNSRAEDFISSYYVSVNPMDRYNDNAKGDLE